MRTILLFFILLIPFASYSQDGYGNQWIFGRFNDTQPSGTILNFNGDTLKIVPIDKPMELEGSCAIMCDSIGKLLFYSNGCYIANATHQMMVNGDSIGLGLLQTSFCNTGGNPIPQGMIALPKPGNNHLYYLFYTDISTPYEGQPFFPLAPVTLYCSVINMTLDNGLGAVVEKNKIILQDTFSRGLIQAERHANNKDWWIIMPKSHSNCYWTFRFTENGIDTVFKQCIGQIWGDDDSAGQSVFSPNSNQYARMNYSYGLSIFEFDRNTGIYFDPQIIDFEQDSFYEGGVEFSSNSRFLYASCFTKLWQFDTWASDIATSRIMIGELNTPPNISNKTRFNQARLASDGKIYISGTGPHKYLHVINRPNCLGLGCDLQQYSIELAAENSYTMPNMPHYKHWNETDTCETVSVKTPINLKPPLVRIQPNPAIAAAALNVPDGRQGDIQIVNTLGQVVSMQKITSPQTNLNLSTVPIGTYFVNIVYSDGQRESIKLIITR